MELRPPAMSESRLPRRIDMSTAARIDLSPDVLKRRIERMERLRAYHRYHQQVGRAAGVGLPSRLDEP